MRNTSVPTNTWLRTSSSLFAGIATVLLIASRPAGAAARQDDSTRLSSPQILRLGLEGYVRAYEKAAGSRFWHVDAAAWEEYARCRRADNQRRMERLPPNRRRLARQLDQALTRWEHTGIRIGWGLAGGGTRGRMEAARAEPVREDFLGRIIRDLQSGRAAPPHRSRGLQSAFRRGARLCRRAEKRTGGLPAHRRDWVPAAHEYATWLAALRRHARHLPRHSQARLATYMNAVMERAEDYGLGIEWER